MSLSAGTRLGPYEILALIGAGGMGEVYRARDPRLGRDIAIKVLRGGLDQDMLERFEREARVIAALAHPNTLAVFDVGTEGGIPYLVTELLDGETLRARLRAGRLAVAEALAIARQVADALIATHDKGIVHRDLKPENVFILPRGIVKLLDFGLARQLPSPKSDEAGTMFATMPGTFLGTVGYMAPEQARGYECDARADLFALGAMLYEMLAGERPFAGETAADAIAGILTANPRPFPAHAAVPTAVDLVVRRAMVKDPTGRFQSARDFAAALDMLSHGADHAPGTAVAAAERSLAVLPFADLSPAHDHDYFCDGMAEEIIGGLAKVPGLRVAAASASFRFRGRETDLKEVGSALNVDAALEGSVRTAGQRLRIAVRLTTVAEGHVAWSEQFDRDLSDVFAVQDEIARTVVAALRVTLTSPLASRLVQPPTQSTEAYALYLKGRFHWNKRTESALVESIECFQQAIALDPRFARAVAGLADAHTTLGIYGLRAPDQVMPQAKAAALDALRLDDRLPDAHAALGTVRALYDWAWPEAEEAFRRAIALDPGYATGLQWYAVHGLAPLGRFDEAVGMLTRALAVDPVSLPINVSIGLLHYLEGRLTSAAAVLERALDLDPRFPMAHFFLGHALTEQGNHTRALIHIETAAALSDYSPETLGALGYAYARAGNTERARDALARLDACALTRYVSPGFAAQVHVALGDEPAALERLDAAVQTHAADVAWIAVRPVFGTLRGRPAFDALVERLHLSAALTGSHASRVPGAAWRSTLRDQ